MDGSVEGEPGKDNHKREKYHKEGNIVSHLFAIHEQESMRKHEESS